MRRLHHPLNRWPVGMSQGEIRAAKRLHAMERIAKSHEQLGRMLGYPPCCVDAFTSPHRDDPDSEWRDPCPEWDGSGFIPCPGCREREPLALHREIMARRRANGVRLQLRSPVLP